MSKASRAEPGPIAADHYASMLLHYYRTLPNFGDALNPWLWNRLLPGRFSPDDNIVFLGIGTILQANVPDASRYLVLGAGSGYGALPTVDSRWEFHAVRGPLTAAALHLPREAAVTDAAYLLRLTELPPARTGKPIGFMPHWRSLRRIPWRAICEFAGLRFINPFAPVEHVLAELRGCDRLVTEAMHGAIVADLLRVPWVPVRLGDHFLDFKWRDWLAAMELDCSAIPLQPMDPWTEHRPTDGLRMRASRQAVNLVGYYVRSGPLAVQLRTLRKRIETRAQPVFLSSDSVLQDRVDTLERRLEAVRLAVPAESALRNEAAS